MRRTGKTNKRKQKTEEEPEISEDEGGQNGTEESPVVEQPTEEPEEDAAAADDAGPATTTTKKAAGKSKKKGKSGKKASGKKAPKRAKVKEQPEEEEDEEEEEFEVEAVVGSRYMRGKRQFKVRWRGHGAEEDSWCGESDLHCQDLIDEYLDSNPDESEAKTSGSKKGGKKAKAAAPTEEEDDDETDYEVERVLDVKHKKNGKREFLIRWKGFSAASDSWEPEENLSCTELINKLMEKVDKGKELAERELRTKPKQTDRLTLNNPQIRTSRRNVKEKGGRKTYHDLLE